MELKLKVTTTSPVGGWWVVGGWTETKLMLSQLKLKLNLKLELSLAIRTSVNQFLSVELFLVTFAKTSVFNLRPILLFIMLSNAFTATQSSIYSIFTQFSSPLIDINRKDIHLLDL